MHIAKRKWCAVISSTWWCLENERKKQREKVENFPKRGGTTWLILLERMDKFRPIKEAISDDALVSSNKVHERRL